jgi:hypothetical protein
MEEEEIFFVAVTLDPSLSMTRRKRLLALARGLALSYDGVPKGNMKPFRKILAMEEPIYIAFDGAENAQVFMDTARYYIHPEWAVKVSFSLHTPDEVMPK